MEAEDKAHIISKILRLEWPMFHAVNNEGGRAACQNNQDDFVIVRSIYYMVWDLASLESLLKDFQTAIEEARNMVTEKYARMMEYSDPDYYRVNLKPYLPQVGGEITSLAKQITNHYLEWESDFTLKYPAIAKRSRRLTAGLKSMESGEKEYLLGELQTYSHETLKKYAAHIGQMRDGGVNPVFRIREMMVRLGGYQSLDDAERRIGRSE